MDVEIHRRHILGIVYSLNGMRMSEAYWHMDGLANQLREVEESAMKFLDAGDAENAFEILLVLLEESIWTLKILTTRMGNWADLWETWVRHWLKRF